MGGEGSLEREICIGREWAHEVGRQNRFIEPNLNLRTFVFVRLSRCAGGVLALCLLRFAEVC